ncbi:MAG TPA: energy transducer TonB [Cyclobacteriaceae bacterium]|nr:energy transducer TonB [Cyclobacteriaceae bacterium]
MKLAVITIAMLLFTAGFVHGQSTSELVYSPNDVDTEPEPDGGMQAFYQAWSKKITYPTEARRKGIQGKTFISFIITETGMVTNYEVLQGLGGGCDEAAIQAMKATNINWSPGIKDGKKVKVKKVLPFVFKLG